MSAYVELMSKRKEANWKGDYKLAAKLLKEARDLIRKGEVTDEELEMTAYIWIEVAFNPMGKKSGKGKGKGGKKKKYN